MRNSILLDFADTESFAQVQENTTDGFFSLPPGIQRWLEV